jgi:hypothetical protein
MQMLRTLLGSIAVITTVAACGGDIPCGGRNCTGGQACVTDPRHGEVCATLCGDSRPVCGSLESCEMVGIVPPVPGGVDHNATTVQACLANQ